MYDETLRVIQEHKNLKQPYNSVLRSLVIATVKKRNKLYVDANWTHLKQEADPPAPHWLVSHLALSYIFTHEETFRLSTNRHFKSTQDD
jgi:hypothetical protein